jgi:hypothetical protein
MMLRRLSRRLLLGSASLYVFDKLLAPARAVLPINVGISFADGSINAPPGPPQYPTLLALNSPGTQTFGATYLARPPWKVAGVDYHVGIDRTLYPSNANLLDPLVAGQGPGGTIAPALVALGAVWDGNNPTQQIDFGSTGATIEGYDFSLHGGLTIALGINTTVKNCNFGLGSTNGTAVGVGIWGGDGLTITQCEFNGFGQTQDGFGGRGMIQHTGVGSCNITYNWIRNSFAEHIVCGQNTAGNTTTDYIYKFNIFENCGLGFVRAGTHGDLIAIQVNGQLNTLRTFSCTFNLIIQIQGNTQGFSWQNGSNITNYEVSNNTFCTFGGVAPNNVLTSCWVINTNGTTGNAGQTANNYVDGSTLQFFVWSYTWTGTTAGTINTSGTISLTSGATYSSPTPPLQ